MKKITAILLVLAVALVSVFAVDVAGPGAIKLNYDVTEKFDPKFIITIGSTEFTEGNENVYQAEDWHAESLMEDGKVAMSLIDNTYANCPFTREDGKFLVDVTFTYPTKWVCNDDPTKSIDGPAISEDGALAVTTGLAGEGKAYFSLGLAQTGKTVEIAYNFGKQDLTSSSQVIATFGLKWTGEEDLDAGRYSATLGIHYSAR